MFILGILTPCGKGSAYTVRDDGIPQTGASFGSGIVVEGNAAAGGERLPP